MKQLLCRTILVRFLVCLTLGRFGEANGKPVLFSPLAGDLGTQEVTALANITSLSSLQEQVESSSDPINAVSYVARSLEASVVPENVTSSVASSIADVANIARDQVSLELPDNLFSSVANLTLQLRKFIGDFITNTSVRIAQVVRFFQPLFGYHLMIDIPEELDV